MGRNHILTAEPSSTTAFCHKSRLWSGFLGIEKNSDQCCFRCSAPSVFTSQTEKANGFYDNNPAWALELGGFKVAKASKAPENQTVKKEFFKTLTA